MCYYVAAVHKIQAVYANRVEDTPRQYDRNLLHRMTIAANRKLPSLFMPLKMQGGMSYIDTRKSTEVEMETTKFYEVTTDIPWDPYSDRFDEEEASYRVSSIGSSPNSKFCQKPSVVESMVDPVKSEYLEFIARPQRLSSCSSRISALIMDLLEDKDSRESIQKPSIKDSREPTPLGRSSKKVKISPQMLAKKWQISLTKAKQTITATTQKGTRKHGEKLV